MTKTSDGGSAAPAIDKLYMYIAQARFLLDKPPGAVGLSRYITLPFLQKVDSAVKHQTISASDVPPLDDERGAGNANPDRKWCTGRAALICIQSSYKLEGKIPIGILLANKLRDSAKRDGRSHRFPERIGGARARRSRSGRYAGIDRARHADRRRARAGTCSTSIRCSASPNFLRCFRLIRRTRTRLL